MSQTRSELLLDQMNKTHENEGWFVPFSQALEGLTAAQASWRPAPELSSIWQILTHLTFWKEYLVGRLNGEAPRPGGINNDSTFGRPTDPADEQGWHAAQVRAKAAQAAFGQLAAAGDKALDRIYQEQTLGQLIADVTAHDAYHLGQIVLIRKLQGSWPASRT